jgi:toxin co-regulated pilus biosynthesis protein E
MSVAPKFERIKKSIDESRKIIPLKERVELYRTLNTYVDNNINVEIFFGRKRRSGSTAAARAFSEIDQSLREGGSLSGAMKPYIPHDEYVFVSAAELQTNMGLMLGQLVGMVEKKNQQNKSFKQAMIIPIVAYLVTMFILALVVFYVAPMIMDIVGTEAKKMTWVPNVFYPMLVTFMPFYIIASPLILIFIQWWLPNGRKGGLRQYLDRIPPFSSYKDLVASQFMIATASALKGKISFSTALHLQTQVAPFYVRSWLSEIQDNFRESEMNDVEALDIGLIGEIEMDVIEDYFITHDFSEAMIRIGQDSLEVTTARIESQFRVMTLVIGVVSLVSLVAIVGIIVGYMGANTSTPDINF